MALPVIEPFDEHFEVSDFPLLCGSTLPCARVVFETHGTLSRDADNVILFPTWFTSSHRSNRWLIGAGRALDPGRYFIVSVGLLGNGLSSSPSNTPAPFDGPRFPAIAVLDNVRLQKRLLEERFGVSRLALVIGRSMGAQAAFQWATSFPEQVDRMFALCGSAKTTPHNYVFLDSLKAALQADSRWCGGDYVEPPVDGLRAIGRAYAAWALSPEFYRRGLHLTPGASSIDAYLEQNWAGNFLRCDANDLLSMLHTWQHADVANDPDVVGDWCEALARATVEALVMPSRTDLYFPPEDSAAAVACMPHARLRVLESVWGHRAGSLGSDAADIGFVDASLRALLAERPFRG
jgi:homoserine O-acetyltransferase